MSSVSALVPVRALGGMVFRTAQVLCIACLGVVGVAVALVVLGLLMAAGVTVGVASLVYGACVYIIGS